MFILELLLQLTKICCSAFFFFSEYDLMSPELHYFLNYTSSTVLVTSFLGAFIHANKARDDYMRRNVASTYESDFKARVSLVVHFNRIT